MNSPRVWNMFARLRDGQIRNVNLHARTVEMYGTRREDVIAVICTEDAEGSYYGVIRKDNDYPSIIQHSRNVFAVQFPYGFEDHTKYHPEEEIVRMNVSIAE